MEECYEEELDKLAIDSNNSYVNISPIKLIHYTEDGVEVKGHPLSDMVCRRDLDGGWICYSTKWIYKDNGTAMPGKFDTTTENQFIHRKLKDSRGGMERFVRIMRFELAERPVTGLKTAEQQVLNRDRMKKVFFNEHELIWRRKRIEYENKYPDWLYATGYRLRSTSTRSYTWYFKNKAGKDEAYSVNESDLIEWLSLNDFKNGDWQNTTKPDLSYYDELSDFCAYLLYVKIEKDRKSGLACKKDEYYNKNIWDMDV